MAESYRNYFSPKTVAERYLKGRPQYHSFVVGKIKESLSVKKPFSFALDVGCGTGFSSVALREIAEKVVGLDVSVEMLCLATRENEIEYVAASAEKLPFCENKFDFVTVSQAIHWIDKGKFFAEADRVLKPKSFIVAYDNYFLGKIVDNSEFNDWYKNEFLKTFPTPPRAKRTFAKESENLKDFVLVKEEWHENEIEFSVGEIVDFLITLTNVINSVEKGAKAIEDVESWLLENIKKLFSENERKKFEFIAPIWYLRQENYKLKG